jgi:hypothetical protein
MEHTNSKGVTYYLNRKNVKFGGKMRDIYYFSKAKNKATYCEEIPAGYIIFENKKTGLPMLKPKK